MLDALQEVDSQKLTHYDAHCPRCRRATPIPRQKLEMAMPNWRDELKQFESEMKENPQHEAPLPKPEEEAAAPTPPAPEPVPAKKSAKAQAASTDAKKTATKKGASKKSS
jgi:hypothetical protein